MPATQFLINGDPDGHISPLDRGFAYGDGVFRTMEAQHDKVRHWELHYRKLSEDCRRLDIVCPPSNTLLADIEKLQSSSDEQYVIKVIVTRGEGARGYALPLQAEPNRVIVKSAYPQYPLTNFTQGVRLHLCQIRLGHQPRLAGIKHLNRLENVLARMEWSQPDIADGLLLDSEGNVIECTSANLFARVGKTLFTPDLTRCGVAGITRQRILDISVRLGFDVKIADISLTDMMDADEVIMCNSLYGAWQVIEFNNKQWIKQPLAETIREQLQDEF